MARTPGDRSSGRHPVRRRTGRRPLRGRRTRTGRVVGQNLGARRRKAAFHRLSVGPEGAVVLVVSETLRLRSAHGQPLCPVVKTMPAPCGLRMRVTARGQGA